MGPRYVQIGRPVTDSDCWWATELAARVGPAKAAKRIGVSRSTLAAIIAGLPVAASTEDRVRAARQRTAA